MSTKSILTSIKKNLGIAEGYTAFDPDIVMYINGVLADLHQIGVGPPGGFMIEDASAEWDAFFGGDPRLNNIQSYVTLKVRMIFDPPTTSFHLEALNTQIREKEWRIMVATTPIIPEAPIEPPVVPVGPVNPPGDFIIDGGDLDA